MGNRLPGQILQFFVYVVLQVLIMKNIVLFDRAFCFIYVAFLLLLPLESGKLPLIFLGFITGLIIDVFYDSLGIHTAASVLIMYLRPYWMNVITTKGSEENVYSPTLRNMGFEWFVTYALPLIFIHHLALFFIEAGGFHMVLFTFTKVILSTLLTFIFIVIFQYLFYPKERTI
ncbi:MAG: Rod shape-determining protein MreD [Candidatus Cyclobacteriaceae bacterium M3_2C_046]